MTIQLNHTIVYARDTPSGKRKFTHWPGSNAKGSVNEIVSCRTLGASGWISVTIALCRISADSKPAFLTRTGDRPTACHPER